MYCHRTITSFLTGSCFSTCILLLPAMQLCQRLLKRIRYRGLDMSGVLQQAHAFIGHEKRDRYAVAHVAHPFKMELTETLT